MLKIIIDPIEIASGIIIKEGSSRGHVKTLMVL